MGTVALQSQPKSCKLYSGFASRYDPGTSPARAAWLGQSANPGKWCRWWRQWDLLINIMIFMLLWNYYFFSIKANGDVCQWCLEIWHLGSKAEARGLQSKVDGNLKKHCRWLFRPNEPSECVLAEFIYHSNNHTTNNTCYLYSAFIKTLYNGNK